MMSILVLSGNSYIRFGIISILNDILNKISSSMTLQASFVCDVKNFFDGENKRKLPNLLFIDMNHTLSSEVVKCVDTVNENTLIFLLGDERACNNFIFNNDEKCERITLFPRNINALQIEGRVRGKIENFLYRGDGKKYRPESELLSKLFYNAKNLTKNEIGVMNHLFRGLTGKAIAIKLNKSEKTISGQKRSAMKKLNVTSTAELVNRFGIANHTN
ncbi:helix-turn-helix transcriptional regulator [Yersinia enterocolitica]|uniref:helix-turn-helix transcriptional regulator n=1 Tax=Yersinia enterocolitica TaxID=630 RepID=UPI003CFD913D